MKYILLFFWPIFFLFSFGFSQTQGQATIQGSIMNARTGKPIPFVTVGLLRANRGTTASEAGIFILEVDSERSADTLIFTSVGYETLRLPFNRTTAMPLSIKMTEKAQVLKEVVITNRPNKTLVLNNFKSCGNSFVGSSGYQTQLAQHFKVDVEDALLKEVKICRMGMAILDPEKTRFRIRIYGMDAVTGAPSADLCAEVIEVKTKSQIIRVDLVPYQIRIPQQDFFVAIEWMKIDYNVKRSIVSENGKEVTHITYRPSIGWTDKQDDKMEAWMLDYRGKWRPMFRAGNMTSVSISATVEY